MVNKRILYINYWGINEGLTQASSLPSINILDNSTVVEKVLFVTIERGHNSNWHNPFHKTTHIPLQSKKKQFNLLNKLDDYLVFPKSLVNLCLVNNINYIIARGASAGSLAYLVSKKVKLPFIVESFEPHADYMLDGGVWGKCNIKYIIQKFFEYKQKKNASALITVSSHFKNKLLKEGLKNIFVARCPIDKFFFSNVVVKKPKNSITGIYVGKFGDIYYRKEVISLFEHCYDYFDNFKLVIATPQCDDFIQQLKIKFPKSSIKSYKHDEIPELLAKANFGIATIKQSKVRKYCSPIKVGEYWSAGLPVLLTKGVGDDSDILNRTELGAVFDINDQQSILAGLSKINSLIFDPTAKSKIQELARTYRSIVGLEKIYDEIFLK